MTQTATKFARITGKGPQPVMVLSDTDKAEAAKLRRIGWSISGIARRYGCTDRDIEIALGVVGFR